jgi:hypothetical protein
MQAVHITIHLPNSGRKLSGPAVNLLDFLCHAYLSFGEFGLNGDRFASWYFGCACRLIQPRSRIRFCFSAFSRPFLLLNS